MRDSQITKCAHEFKTQLNSFAKTPSLFSLCLLHLRSPFFFRFKQTSSMGNRLTRRADSCLGRFISFKCFSSGDLFQIACTKLTLDHNDQCNYDVHLLHGDLSSVDGL